MSTSADLAWDFKVEEVLVWPRGEQWALCRAKALRICEAQAKARGGLAALAREATEPSAWAVVVDTMQPYPQVEG